MHVIAFYKFVPLTDLESLRRELDAFCREHDIVGTTLIAEEGINGTMAGLEAAIGGLRDKLRKIPGLADLQFKASQTSDDNPVFLRTKIRIKNEIVALGQGAIDVVGQTGEHVDPQTWHTLLDDPDVTVIDTRNSYEIEVGSFPGAIDPQTRSFKDFPEFVEENLAGREHEPVAMFCTGGIRCEKASAYLKEQGFSKVFQLNGGVLGYLESVPAESNRWQGECFVFDQRVAVDKQLKEGDYIQCHACRRPLSPEQARSPEFKEGVSCPLCIGETSDEAREGFEERQRQVALAEQRGQRHIGAQMPEKG
ncbi:MAG: rhodanese-related sulfurtransferase [Pseudomonadaceae bacterium]|nr:rhodanese-related sulfurtransferase [Pseudomonadaceae bacterium]